MVASLDKGVLISADSHVTEPHDLWTTRLPAQFRDQAPKFAPPGENDKRGGWDPKARVAEMAQDGVSAEVLYPTKAMRMFGLEDAALQEACFRVYNDWIIEYCQEAGERLVGISTISVYDVDNAIKELERTAKAGLAGTMIWQAPKPDMPLHSGHYERFWAAAAELQQPVSLHILTGFSYHTAAGGNGPNRGVEAYRGSVNWKLIDGANGLFDVVFYGVLDRHPDLKVVIVENEIGWLPWIIQQWDYYYRRFGSVNPLPISHEPSYYCDRQVYATFFNDSAGGHALGRWGQENCMWSSDYPHPNTTWPNSRKVIERDIGHLPAEVQAKLVRENVSRLYNIPIPTAVGA